VWKGCVLGVLATVAACSADRPGLAVEVTSDTPVSKIEVFLGQAKCIGPDGGACAITPPDLTAALRPNVGGGAWYRDGDSVFESAASGGGTWFRIEPTGSAAVLQLIAVGFDAGGVPVASGILHDLAIPADKTTYLTLALVGSGVIDATEEAMMPHPDGELVRIWNNASSDCVVSEHWHAGKATRTFIVPRDDADCDGFATADPLECDPLWNHRTTESASLRGARCVTPKVLGNGTGGGVPTCVLGGSPCLDGVGPSSASCAAVDPTYCLPTPMCDPACASGPTPACLSQFTPSQLHCTISADDSGNPCDTALVVNPQSGTTLMVATLLGTTTTTFKSVAFGDLTPWNMLAPMSAWSAPAPATAKLRATPSSTAPGELDMSWTGGPVNGALAGTATLQWGMVDLTLSNDRHMLIPLRVGYALCPPANVRQFGIDCYLALGMGDGVTACAN
jgi:hypothetical protein